MNVRRMHQDAVKRTVVPYFNGGRRVIRQHAANLCVQSVPRLVVVAVPLRCDVHDVKFGAGLTREGCGGLKDGIAVYGEVCTYEDRLKLDHGN